MKNCLEYIWYFCPWFIVPANFLAFIVWISKINILHFWHTNVSNVQNPLPRLILYILFVYFWCTVHSVVYIIHVQIRNRIYLFVAFPWLFFITSGIYPKFSQTRMKSDWVKPLQTADLKPYKVYREDKRFLINTIICYSMIIVINRPGVRLSENDVQFRENNGFDTIYRWKKA